MTKSSINVLRVDSSISGDASNTRKLLDRFINSLNPQSIVNRDVNVGIDGLTGDWVSANFTAEEDRSEAQKEALALSDTLIDEVFAADLLVIGVPIYNFAIPAALKNWVDMIARARKTFRYSEDGPEGLVKGKKAYLLVASGGTGVGSDIDFATPYMKHVLGFIGITDVEIIAADAMAMDEKSLENAEAKAVEKATSLRDAA
ncbi:FMN-dependent NADH-azoreductase [Kordiimonas sediminis]|uniref:FMN dependent NADH:quinone oxidoreductase n=1 Tax=Kordiimonas sediminis TaxID=1735581 RepID=A0A919ATN3_9PROT|nr:NAD(P)H-dependent oxidoreductase [Kordiimonas sediminis]GHF23642.1 FMN-dependent NADH-azoreductase [Kordiimonas sediminis]